jgi:uncharacterized protein YjbJ (UPF0337 family)
MNDGMREKAEELKGRAKEAVGDLTDDDRMKAEGEVHQDHAQAKENFNEAADDLTETEAEKRALGE